MTTITPTPVVKTVTVACAPARAFDLFTAGMGRWWQPSHSLTRSGQADVVIEPRTGGAWYELGKQGERCDWGHVASWDPPARLVLIWRLSPDFAYDPSLHTEVEVTFTPEGSGTRVRLEHRMLENYGAAGAQMAHVFDSPNGWGGLIGAYMALAGRGDQA
ncbi:MAG: SRPBCC family protein [Tabrizicola sp.]|nr:SRPBCC family protein [Tabrizicola sp.]